MTRPWALAGWLLALALGVVLAAMLTAPHFTRVPEVVARPLGKARGYITSAGLVIGTATLKDGRAGGLDPEQVDAVHPPQGTWVLRGSTVDLQTSTEDTGIAAPSLLGMFSHDAHTALTAAGLRYSGPTDTVDLHGEQTATSDIVFAQDPAPGTLLPYGSIVHVSAEFPHLKSGDSTRVASVHGAFYLRYGINGAPECRQCHVAPSCSNPKCHPGPDFKKISIPMPFGNP